MLTPQRRTPHSAGLRPIPGIASALVRGKIDMIMAKLQTRRRKQWLGAVYLKKDYDKTY
jgi:hypothetical protein